MANKTIDLRKSLDNLRTYSQNVCRIAAGEIRDELTKEAASAIAYFYYENYPDPKVYERHFQFEKKSFEKYYAKSGKYYYGGVRLTPEKMDSVYDQSVDTVFNSVFYLGMHGPIRAYMRAGNQLPLMRPTPLEWIQKKRDKIIANPQEYIERAKRKLKK